MFKGLRQVLGRIQNTPIVHIGDVDVKHVAAQFTLWRLNRNAPFPCHTAYSNFRDATEERFAGCMAGGRTKCASHDVCCRIGGLSTSTEVSRKFSSAKVCQDGRCWRLV